MRVAAYGPDMLRVQVVGPEQALFADDHYEMVLTHAWPGALSKDEDEEKQVGGRGDEGALAQGVVTAALNAVPHAHKLCA